MSEVRRPRSAAEATSSDVESALAALRRDVLGPVHGPADVEVVTELAGANLALEHAPAAVVGATGAGDVAAAVRWAADQGLGVSVVATGHSDWSHRGRLVISTRRMDAVHVDPVTRTATVGAGVKWARLVEAAAPHGLAGLNGSSGDVGVVGYTVGGGLGPFARTHGYAADKVRRMEVVTGDGVVREVTAEEDPELFRALLGGKDVAGIVTQMTFELVELPRFYGGSVFYDGADASVVLHAWRTWAPALTEEMTTSVAILRLPDLDTVPPPLRGRTVVQLRVAHLGSAESGRALLAPMRATAAPLIDTVDERPYTEVDAIYLDPTEPMPAWVTGAYLSEVDDGTVEALLAVAGPQLTVPIVLVDLRQADGAAMRGTAGCLPRAPYVLGVVAPMPPELRAVAPGVGHAVVEALAPWATGRVPANWAAPQTLGLRPDAVFGPREADRLAAVVRRVDPDGVLGADRFGVRTTTAVDGS
jgi:hypothetical protein